MEIKVNDYHFNNSKVNMDISLFQWIQLKINGSVGVFVSKKPGWKFTQFYVFKCKKCEQYALDYLHSNRYLDCPLCNKERYDS